jgi:hypothetical protein
MGCNLRSVLLANATRGTNVSPTCLQHYGERWTHNNPKCIEAIYAILALAVGICLTRYSCKAQLTHCKSDLSVARERHHRQGVCTKMYTSASTQRHAHALQLQCTLYTMVYVWSPSLSQNQIEYIYSHTMTFLTAKPPSGRHPQQKSKGRII